MKSLMTYPYPLRKNAKIRDKSANFTTFLKNFQIFGIKTAFHGAKSLSQ
jgi:hypothetical protein